MRTPFVSLVFSGPRFRDGSFPLEALPELVAYRELILAAARALFQVGNPARQRLPKGFEASFKLVLERVETGSAVPIISREFREGGFPFDAQPVDYFSAAKEEVERFVRHGPEGSSLPDEFRRGVLARFGTFGMYLSEQDSLTIAQPGLREGAIYNRAVRKKLLLAAQATYEDEVHLVGEVRAADKDTEGFFLRVAGGARVQVKALPLFFPVALKSLQESALVRVRGTGVFDADGTLLRVTSATDVSSAEEGDEVTTKGGCGIPVPQQIEALGALQPGWYDSESPAYETENLGWLEKLLEGLLDGFGLPVPYVYPTPEGRVRIEWPGAHQEIVVTFDLTASSADAIVVHLDSDESSELAVSFKKPGAESRLGSFIARHVSAE